MVIHSDRSTRIIKIEDLKERYTIPEDCSSIRVKKELKGLGGISSIVFSNGKGNTHEITKDDIIEYLSPDFFNEE